MASKRRIRRGNCTGKVVYPTRDRAIDAATALWHKRGRHLVAYQCQFGSHFHLGHNGKHVDSTTKG